MAAEESAERELVGLSDAEAAAACHSPDEATKVLL